MGTLKAVYEFVFLPWSDRNAFAIKLINEYEIAVKHIENFHCELDRKLYSPYPRSTHLYTILPTSPSKRHNGSGSWNWQTIFLIFIFHLSSFCFILIQFSLLGIQRNRFLEPNLEPSLAQRSPREGNFKEDRCFSIVELRSIATVVHLGYSNQFWSSTNFSHLEASNRSCRGSRY